MSFMIPAFGEKQFSETMSNRSTRVVNICNAGEQLIASYSSLLEQNGYLFKESTNQGSRSYCAWQLGDTGVFMNYYGELDELHIVIEENCRYFDFDSRGGVPTVSPQITQVYLVDYAMAYAIRLSDGRFIVIDGGWGFAPDVDELIRVLEEGANGKKPVVAAWFLTHPHRDHYLCLDELLATKADRVCVEKVLMNFPEADDLAHYPELAKEHVLVENTASIYRVPQMLEKLNNLGIPIFQTHTGQCYRIGDAVCQILSCMNDTILYSQHLNPASQVIRMELGGQVILWTADAALSTSRLVERYGDYLKADILQVPHHGFQSGTAEGEIHGYQKVKPDVCLLPASDYIAYTAFCTHKEGTRYLMTKLGIGELITGEKTRTLTLPYTPPAYAREELRKRVASGLRNCGAYTWMFSDLDSGNKEDFVFSVLNTAYVQTEITINLYFETPGRNISDIKLSVPPKSFRRVCIIDRADVVTNGAYFNYDNLDVKGIPENTSFAVRFISKLPVVISHKEHKASYSSDNP